MVLNGQSVWLWAFSRAKVGLPGQVAVSEPGVIQAPELVQADVESPEVLELVHHAAGLVGLVLQLLPPPVQGGDAPGEGIEIGSEILQGGRGVEGGIGQGDARLIGHLHRAVEECAVGVFQLQGPQALHAPHELQGVFRVELLVDDAGAHHIVKPLQRPGDGEQLHRDNGHCGSSFLDMGLGGLLAHQYLLPSHPEKPAPSD